MGRPDRNADFQSALRLADHEIPIDTAAQPARQRLGLRQTSAAFGSDRIHHAFHR
jgi:hypothetical protein